MSQCKDCKENVDDTKCAGCYQALECRIKDLEATALEGDGWKFAAALAKNAFDQEKLRADSAEAVARQLFSRLAVARGALINSSISDRKTALDKTTFAKPPEWLVQSAFEDIK